MLRITKRWDGGSFRKYFDALLLIPPKLCSKTAPSRRGRGGLDPVCGPRTTSLGLSSGPLDQSRNVMSRRPRERRFRLTSDIKSKPMNQCRPSSLVTGGLEHRATVCVLDLSLAPSSRRHSIPEDPVFSACLTGNPGWQGPYASFPSRAWHCMYYRTDRVR